MQTAQHILDRSGVIILHKFHFPAYGRVELCLIETLVKKSSIIAETTSGRIGVVALKSRYTLRFVIESSKDASNIPKSPE